MKYELKGHKKDILKFQNHLFLQNIFTLTPNLLKSYQECKHYGNTSKVIQGHIRPLSCKNHSSTFVYGPILMKICMKSPFFNKIL